VKMYSLDTINAALTATKIQTENKNICIILILFFNIYFYSACSFFRFLGFVCRRYVSLYKGGRIHQVC
jgi:hypothetical protein